MVEPQPVRETRFTMDTSSIKFGPGATREVGADMARLGARRVMVVTDPRLAASETVAVDARRAARRGDRRRALRPGPRRADRRLVPGRRRLRHRWRVRRLRRGRRRQRHRHRQGGQPLRHLPGAAADLRQPADRRREAGARTAQAADRHPDHRRHRVRDDRRRHLRLRGRCTPRPASPTAPCARRWASSTPTTPARCRRWWPPARRSMCSPTPSSRSPPCPTTSGPRRSTPVCGPPIRARTRSATSGRRKAMEMMARNIARAVDDPTRRRGARGDAAGRRLRRHRVRQRGRASAARHVLPGLGHGPRLCPAWLPGRPPDRAARHVGHPQRPGRFPLDRAGQPGAPPGSRSAARRGHRATPTPDDAGEMLATQIETIMRRVGMPNGLSGVGSVPTTSTRWSPGTLPQHRVTKLSPRPAGGGSARAVPGRDAVLVAEAARRKMARRQGGKTTRQHRR